MEFDEISKEVSSGLGYPKKPWAYDSRVINRTTLRKGNRPCRSLSIAKQGFLVASRHV